MTEKYNLTEEELQIFMKIRSNKYGEGGSFFGMCINQSLTHNISFENILKANLGIQARIEKTYEEGLKDEKPSTISFNKVVDK